MPNEPRIQSRDLPFTCAEPAYREAQEATPRAIALSSVAGSMTANTITMASITAAHTGYYAIPADGDARGEVRQIKSVTGTTATLDQSWSATTNVTSIRLWQPPDIPVVGTSAGTTATVVSSAHASLTNEPDDFFNSKGYILLGRNSTFAGKCYTESDFTSSTGTFTVSPVMDATPGVGAFFDLRHLVRCEGPIEAQVNQKTLTRRIVGFQQADAAIPITSEGSVSFTLAQKPITTAGTYPGFVTPPLDIRDYLTDIFTETLDQGDANGTMSGSVLSSTHGTLTAGGFGLLHTG